MRSLGYDLIHKIMILLFIYLLSACSTYSPSSQTHVPASPPAAPKNITLLLPLEGPNGGSGQAIQNGFLAAYYYAKENRADAPTVNVVNTYGAGSNIVALYKQAVDKGADFIVGPLTKQEVQALAAQSHLPVPILALNTIPTTKAIPNLYQFGLFPQDEAVQAAVRAKQDGFSRAFIMTPAGSWGENMAKAFEEKWQAEGGTVPSRLAYPPRKNITRMIEKAFKSGASQADIVFLVATPRDARHIKPLLTLYGARNLPVYATSLIYAGMPSEQDHDLEGVLFDDMPWVIEDASVPHPVRSNVQTLAGSAYNRTPRLYALGVDAYHLSHALDTLPSGVAGATGKLTIDAEQRIHRELDWAKFEAAAPQRQ